MGAGVFMGGRIAAAALALAAAASAARGEESVAARAADPVPPASLAPSPVVSPAPPPRDWSVRAGAREEWRLRQGYGPDATDQKAHLALDFGAYHPDDRLSITGAVDAWWDLDGRPPAGATANGLQTVWDGRNPWVDVLALAVDWRPDGALRRLRAGRQETGYGLPTTFDGVSAVVRPGGPDLEVFALGGRAIHFFQVEAGDFEDWIGSAGVAWRVTHALRLEADYRFTRASAVVPGAPEAVSVSHGYGLAARWRGSDALRGRVYARGLDGRVAHAGAAVGADLPFELVLQASALVQPVAFRADVSELQNPYFVTLGESRPYARGGLDLSRTFTSAAGVFGLQAGWQGRAVLSGPEGPFNRSFGRVFVLASGTGLAGTGLFASASAERLGDDAALSGNGLWAADGAAGWERGGLHAELGTGYQRYQYTYYQTAAEVADVRSFWAEVRWRATRALSFRARATRDVSSSVLHGVFVSAAQAFE